MKHPSILCIFLLALLSTAATAQKSTVFGQIVDTSQAPVATANVVFTSAQDSTLTVGTITNFEGNFQLSISPGYYSMRVSFIGYGELEKNILIDYDTVNLGTIVLSESAIQLHQFTVTGKQTPVIIKGDTTEINAGSYKSNPDANAQDLITKMPTVVVSEGTIQAEGENVKKVLVDGKPFFGSDPNAALKSLPAQVIEKVQIFDDLSDQAKLTGFDDGNSEKTINIITKQEFRNGTFGYVSGGYGSDEKYAANGVLNSFKNDQQLTVIAQTNNVNQQNFSTADLAGVTSSASNQRGGRQGGPPRRPGSANTSGDASDFLVGEETGLVSTNAIGINYSNTIGKKFSLNASYFYNETDNSSLSQLERNYFTENPQTLYLEKTNASSINQNHRFNLRMKYDISEKDALIYTPSITLQNYEGSSWLNTSTLSSEDVLNQSSSNYTSNLLTYSLTNNLLWQHKFSKRGRTLSINLSNSFNPTEADNLLSTTNFYESDYDYFQQESALDQTQQEYEARVMYTEPIGKKMMLRFNYSPSLSVSESQKLTYDLDSTFFTNRNLNSGLSNTFESNYFAQQGGVGFMYRLGRKSIFMFDPNYQYAVLQTSQQFPTEFNAERSFTAFLPKGMLRHTLKNNSTVTAHFRTSTVVPTISQLQNVIDNSNPQQLTIGNAALDQQYQYSFFTRYNKVNSEKSSSFFAMFGGSYTNNYIGNSVTVGGSDSTQINGVTLPEGTQLTQPVNLDGYYNLRMFSTYGFPLEKLKSNLNLNFTAQYSKIPGLINNELNYSHSPQMAMGGVLSSNISEKVDFTLSSNSSVTYSLSSLNPSLNTHYFNQTTGIKLYWNLWKGIVYRTELNHEYYNGLSETFDNNYLLWNMSLGYKFMKDQRAEFSVTAFDLLKQNQSISRVTTESYYEDIETNTLQQYFLFSFRYNFGKYNTQNTANQQKTDRNEPENGKRPF